MKPTSSKSDGRLTLGAILAQVNQHLEPPLGDQVASNPRDFRQRVRERSQRTSDPNQKE